ncbi:MAG: TerD family protein [Oscillospiraceae bacterium]|nr:TerD family protein [Oscillospiraceae bacterium]MDE6776555.1 TerD family protein [Oscillospiraceae bacterium]
MPVNLQKGQKVELKKFDGGVLRRVVVGLGWDEATPQKTGLLGSLFGVQKTPQAIDCDASAFACVNGKVISNKDIVYFGNLTHQSGAIQHMGDNLTGEGNGDDEQIFVKLEDLPSAYDKVVFVVNIYQAEKRNQHFGMIQNAFIRVCDADTNQELCRYNLSENYQNMTAMVFGEIYRYNGQWKFNAIGQGTTDNDIRALARHFS